MRKDSAGRPSKGAPLFLFPLDSAWEMRYDAPRKNRLFSQSFLDFDSAFWAGRQGVVLK